MTMSSGPLMYLLLGLVFGSSVLYCLIYYYLGSRQHRALSRQQILAQISIGPSHNFSHGFTRLADNRADDHPPECTICISEFIEGDVIRVLSRCRHGFHAYCIERWLLSNHSSCPTCRASCRRVLPAETSQQQQQPQQQQQQQQLELQIQEQEQHPQEQEQPLNDAVNDIERFENYFSTGTSSGGNIYGGTVTS